MVSDERAQSAPAASVDSACARPGDGELPPGFVRQIRVAVLFVSGMMRRGCAAILDAAPHVDVVHTGTIDDAALRGVRADIFVVGMAMRSDSGAQAIRTLTERGECVIAVVAPGLQASTALELGSHESVVGDEPEESALVRAIDRVVRGEAPQIPDTESRGLAAISPREQDVLRELSRGSTDREIAGTLGISVRTVQSHLDRIREKTARRRRAELTVLAFELGVAPRNGPTGT